MDSCPYLRSTDGLNSPQPSIRFPGLLVQFDKKTRISHRGTGIGESASSFNQIGVEKNVSKNT
jgi:hypothetical protein